MSIYFTADTHFSQERTLKLSKRPFKNIKEMDLTLLINWNKKVKPGDTVYHLGDFGLMNIRPLLNGKIILVKGNYEINIPELLQGYENYFEEIYENTHKISYVHNNKTFNITMAHEPSKVKNISISENDINLFGHIHKLCMIKPYGLCVSSDAHNFEPISLEDVLFYHNSILNFYNDDVFY
jgi:calcineurin-like phosphoesterase family protein